MIAHSLRASGFDASEDGTGRGTPIVPVAFHNRQGPDISGDITHPLGSKDNGMAVAFDAYNQAFSSVTHPLRVGLGNGSGDEIPIAFAQNQRDEVRTMSVAGALASEPGMKQQTYVAAMNLRGREGGAMPEMDDVASLRAASGGSSRSYVAAMQVRRLTPRECERLQGFPDDYTLIPYRNKPAADGPRYKALGNSMAVPVMRWIGERIWMVSEIPCS
jgi:DNA (cytosine-5)-methyltransferase 1